MKKFKDIIRNIKADESLDYLYSEKEILEGYQLTLSELKQKSIHNFSFKSKSGEQIACFTFDFGSDIITIHVILDYVKKFINDNIGETVLETELIFLNIKLEHLIKESVNYDIIELNNRRLMILTFEGLGIISIILCNQ